MKELGGKALPALRVRAPGLRQSLMLLPLAALAVGGGVQNGVWASAICVVIGAIAVALLLQAAVGRVWATADGIVARSPWRRPRRLGWDQIARFEVLGYWRVLTVRTTDQRRIGLMPYGVFIGESRDAYERLEAYRLQRQGRAG